MSTEVRTAPRPWFKEAMVWLLIMLPAGALAAGVVTLVLAFRNADPEVAQTTEAASRRPQ